MAIGRVRPFVAAALLLLMGVGARADLGALDACTDLASAKNAEAYVQLLPSHVRPRLCRSEALSEDEGLGPNCLAAVKAWFDPSYEPQNEQGIEAFLENGFMKLKKSEKPRLGDVVAFRKRLGETSYVTHVAVWLDAGVVFNKLGTTKWVDDFDSYDPKTGLMGSKLDAPNWTVSQVEWVQDVFEGTELEFYRSKP